MAANLKKKKTFKKINKNEKMTKILFKKKPHNMAHDYQIC